MEILNAFLKENSKLSIKIESMGAGGGGVQVKSK